MQPLNPSAQRLPSTPPPTGSAAPGTPGTPDAPRAATGSDPRTWGSGIGPVVIDHDRIQQRIAEMGRTITEEYRGRPPFMVGVLKGALMFFTDLARAIDLPVELDFIAVSSYGSATKTSGVVRLVKDLDSDLTDRHVLLIEDIVDTGLTLRYLRSILGARNPASLEVCSLLARSSADLDALGVRHVGFTVPDDQFVIGYGLDVDQRYRNLPFIASYTPL